MCPWHVKGILQYMVSRSRPSQPVVCELMSASCLMTIQYRWPCSPVQIPDAPKSIFEPFRRPEPSLGSKGIQVYGSGFLGHIEGFQIWFRQHPMRPWHVKGMLQYMVSRSRPSQPVVCELMSASCLMTIPVPLAVLARPDASCQKRIMTLLPCLTGMSCFHVYKVIFENHGSTSCSVA